jgi:hypothetical protein
MDARLATKIRTIWFLIAIIPVIAIAGLLGLFSIVLVSPLIVYASIKGKHLKDPWGSKKSDFPV